MQIPAKLKSGDEFRGGVIGAINRIIDYLSASRVVGDNSTTRVDQTPAGCVVRAIANGSQRIERERNAADFACLGDWHGSKLRFAGGRVWGANASYENGGYGVGFLEYLSQEIDVSEVADGTYDIKISNGGIYLASGTWKDYALEGLHELTLGSVTVENGAVEFLPNAKGFPGGIVTRPFRAGVVGAPYANYVSAPAAGTILTQSRLLTEIASIRFAYRGTATRPSGDYYRTYTAQGVANCGSLIAAAEITGSTAHFGLRFDENNRTIAPVASASSLGDGEYFYITAYEVVQVNTGCLVL